MSATPSIIEHPWVGASSPAPRPVGRGTHRLPPHRAAVLRCRPRSPKMTMLSLRAAASSPTVPRRSGRRSVMPSGSVTLWMKSAGVLARRAGAVDGVAHAAGRGTMRPGAAGPGGSCGLGRRGRRAPGRDAPCSTPGDRSSEAAVPRGSPWARAAMSAQRRRRVVGPSGRWAARVPRRRPEPRGPLGRRTRRRTASFPAAAMPWESSGSWRQDRNSCASIRAASASQGIRRDAGPGLSGRRHGMLYIDPRGRNDAGAVLVTAPGRHPLGRRSVTGRVRGPVPPRSGSEFQSRRRGWCVV